MVTVSAFTFCGCFDEGNQFDYMPVSSCILFINPADRYGEPLCTLTASYSAFFYSLSLSIVTCLLLLITLLCKFFIKWP